MESAYVQATFNKNSIANKNTQYMTGMQYSSDKVYEEVYKKIKAECDAIGVVDARDIVQWTYNVFVNYERPTNYNKVSGGLPSCTQRAVNAIKAYIALRGIKDAK